MPAGFVEADRDQVLHALLAHVAERHQCAGKVAFELQLTAKGQPS
jgi:hypothetical protein